MYSKVVEWTIEWSHFSMTFHGTFAYFCCHATVRTGQLCSTRPIEDWLGWLKAYCKAVKLCQTLGFAGHNAGPHFFRESEGLGNSRVGLDHPSGCGRGRLLVDGERWFNGFVPARRFREQLMTASTHMRYMCWSTIRGAPCADQSRTNTILDAAELPTCGYHHAHRKPQPEIEKKHCRTVSS